MTYIVHYFGLEVEWASDFVMWTELWDKCLSQIYLIAWRSVNNIQLLLISIMWNEIILIQLTAMYESQADGQIIISTDQIDYTFNQWHQEMWVIMKVRIQYQRVIIHYYGESVRPITSW